MPILAMLLAARNCSALLTLVNRVAEDGDVFDDDIDVV